MSRAPTTATARRARVAAGKVQRPAATPAAGLGVAFTHYAGMRGWLAVCLLAFTNLMVFLDMTIVNVIVPHVAGDLGASTDQGAWTITSYAVAEAITVPLSGWLAQRFGPVKVILWAIAGFGLFSLGCGLTPSLYALVMFRIGQGLCGGPIMPMSQTLIMQVSTPRRRPQAMAIWATTVSVAPALGPLTGGWIADNLGWHWAFFINVPISILLVLIAAPLLAPAETPTRRVPVDKVGMALLVFWIGCLQIMLDIGRDHGWFGDPRVVALAICAGIGFCVFMIWELTEAHPVVDLKVFRHRGFGASVLTLSFGFGAFMSGIVVVPEWLQLYMGYSATQAGSVAGIHAWASIAASQVVVRIQNRFDMRLLVCCGLVWMGITALIRSTWNTSTSMTFIALSLIVQGFGMAMMFIPLNALTMSTVPPDELANAAGLQNFVRTATSAIATSTVLTVWANEQTRARAMLAGRLAPAAAQRALATAGLSPEGARLYISNLVEHEASAISLDHCFQLAALAMFTAAAVVWLVPRRSGRRPIGAATTGH